MGELDINEELNIDTSIETIENPNTEQPSAESPLEETPQENISTEITEYIEVDEPCVALTIIGENRLTDAEVFVRRGLKYTIKSIFTAIALTIMNLFI